MSTIHILRHGQASGGSCYRGSTDDPLTETGWQQMWQAVENQQWDVVVSSPLQRCADFAMQYCQKHQKPLSIEESLQEFHFGEWEGKTAEQLFNDCPEEISHFWQNPYEYTPPGAEKLFDFEQRVLQCWQHLQETHRSQRLLLITHGGVISVILRNIHQIPKKDFFNIQIPLATLVSATDDLDNYYNA